MFSVPSLVFTVHFEAKMFVAFVSKIKYSDYEKWRLSQIV
jgi:hypothetical protein